MLDAAGYKDVNGDGYRKTKQGKTLTLRFYVTTDSPDNQTAGKLIVSWLKDVGIKVTLHGDRRRRADRRPVQLQRQHLRARLGHVHLVLDPGRGPAVHGEHLHAGADYRLRLERLPLDRPRLHEAQHAAVADDRPRHAHPDRAADAEALLRAAPYAILTYPYQLEAYNTDKWQGWVHVPGDSTGAQKGAVLYSYNNIDTYRFVGREDDGDRDELAATRRCSSW